MLATPESLLGEIGYAVLCGFGGGSFLAKHALQVERRKVEGLQEEIMGQDEEVLRRGG